LVHFFFVIFDQILYHNSFVTYYRICNTSSTTGSTSAAMTAILAYTCVCPVLGRPLFDLCLFVIVLYVLLFEFRLLNTPFGIIKASNCRRNVMFHHSVTF